MPECFITNNGSGVTRECLEYLAPLISGETYPRYRGGVPVHYVIKKEEQ